MVFAVRDKIVAAGTVRTDTLERMAVEGKIDLKNFKIIHPRPKNNSFPFLRSTDLYPEWPFAKLSHTSNELAEQVTIALLNMPVQSPAAVAARISGWTIPLDYRHVHNLLKELRMGQYQDLGKITLMDMIQKYLGWIIAALLLLVFMTGISFYVSILNKKLKTAHSKIEKAHDGLEIKVEKRTEELLESEHRYRELSDSLPQVIFEIDAIGNILYVNQNAFDIFKYTKEELGKGLNVIQMIIPEDHDRVMENMQSVLKGNDLGVLEYTALRHDDTTFPVMIHTNLITHNGKPIGVRGLMIDISKQRKMEADLKRRALAIDHSSDTIVITDTTGTITYVNPAFEKITGYSCEEALGKNPRILQSGNHDKFFYNELWETISNGKTWSGRFINKKKDGSRYTEEATISPVFSDKGRIVNYVAVKRDITEKLKLEAQLQQAQKMETIGTLAGGIAHDFNNILSIIIGNAGLALMDADIADSLRKELEEIQTAGERGAALTRQLLAFSRKQIIQPMILDLNKLLAGIEKMLVRLIGEDVETLKITGPALWQVKIDPGQMEQIIMNLAINARDAMPRGGKLTIETGNMDIDKSYCYNHGIEEQTGGYVMLAVSDTGKGMDKEIQKHIFEPFYTTKERGKGTGLGLSTVYGIVKQNNGFVWVYSEPGQGATFKIYLPKAEREVASEGKKQPRETESGGSETILIVEDDDDLRKLAGLILKHNGYKVLEAENGENALRISKEHEEPIELMITDVIMPRMGGRETAEQLQPLRPQMKVLYMSGYTDNAIVHHGVLAADLNFLQKPFSPKDFACKVREVLDKKQD